MSFLRNWRYLPLSLIAIGAMAAFAACGGDDEGDSGGTGTPGGEESPAAGERIQGGKLTVHAIEPQSLDPHFSSFAQDISFQRFLWRGLYSLDIDNKPVPAMADGEPDISEDGKTFTVTLKSGLLWNDGDDLTSEDYVAGIIRTCDPTNAGEYQYLLANIVGCDDYFNALAGPDGDPGTPDDNLEAGSPEVAALRDAVGVKAIDDTTIEFSLLNPGPTFQTILSLWMTFPVPFHKIPDPATPWPAGPDAAGALAFNGPYVLTNYVAGTSASFEPNPNFTAEQSSVGEAPTLDELELRFIDDHAVAVRAFESGELDFALADLTQLESAVSQYEPTGQYYKLIRPSTRGLEMQLETVPLDQLEVRLAIGRGIDWPAMIERCFGNGHEYTTSWIPEGIPAGKPTDEYIDVLGVDIEAAKQQLADAGFPNGEGMPEFRLVVRQGTESECAGQFIQEALRTNLNITANLEALEGPVRSARFREETFDLFPGGWIQDYPDPENWIIGQFDEPGVGLNHYNCDNQEIQDLVAENEFSLDEDARIAAYERINEIISAEVCGIFVYYHEAEHYLKGETVVGMFENSTGQDAVSAGDWAAEAWGLSE
jgi:oligopeptide transport system substrate-binding protein